MGEDFWGYSSQLLAANPIQLNNQLNTIYLKSRVLMTCTLLMPLSMTSAANEVENYTRIGLGAIGLYEPAIYQQADDELMAYPWVEVEYKQWHWDRTRLTYELYEGDWLEIRPLLSLELDGYEAADSIVLEGMEDRDMAVHLGFELEAELTDFLELELEVSRDISNASDGFIVDAGVGLQWPINRQLSMGWTVGMSWHSSDYSDYYFGVTPQEARTNRPAYELGATLNPFTKLQLQYRLNDRWTVGAQIEVTQFDSEISDSPIVDADVGVEMLLGFKYEFYF